MTPKELQYIEDVLGNEQEMQNACTNLASQVQDVKLKTFIQDLSDKHRKCFNDFYNLINS
ncbi:MAG: hypothetical protein ACYCWE_18235 [Eubacteriales bacterium]